MSLDDNPLSLFNRTVLTFLILIISVVIFALVFGLFHCYRKRKAAQALEA